MTNELQKILVSIRKLLVFVFWGGTGLCGFFLFDFVFFLRLSLLLCLLDNTVNHSLAFQLPSL